MAQEFHLLEATITNIHAAYAAGTITARQLTQLYLDRIQAYDRNGPQINSIITVNPNALEEASQADAAFTRKTASRAPCTVSRSCSRTRWMPGECRPP